MTPTPEEVLTEVERHLAELEPKLDRVAQNVEELTRRYAASQERVQELEAAIEELAEGSTRLLGGDYVIRTRRGRNALFQLFVALRGPESPTKGEGGLDGKGNYHLNHHDVERLTKGIPR